MLIEKIMVLLSSHWLIRTLARVKAILDQMLSTKEIYILAKNWVAPLNILKDKKQWVILKKKKDLFKVDQFFIKLHKFPINYQRTSNLTNISW